MSNVIVGTAGHIDHGKTTLIKAMTGVNTDRLKEEQERGITIDLGFAHLLLPSGRRVGIVDVPGHEKFVKNMLAGAGGIDLVLLVVAADEGIMPQTREHLNILQLLNVKRGIVVITKKDLVDEEWLEMVKEDIGEELKGTFLEKSPIIPVSSVTGEGIKELVEMIDRMTEETFERDLDSPFRLPIDRVFSLPGIGTVVTGSLLCGLVSVGENVEIFPKGLMCKVRSIQIHGESRQTAMAGQRTAINLSDVKPEDISRGDVVSRVEAMLPVSRALGSFRLLKDAPRPLKNRDRIRFHAGTGEVMARVTLIDVDELAPGEEAFVSIDFEEPVAVSYKDYYVVRSYSPITTIGGGQILFVNPGRFKRSMRDRVVDALRRAKEGDLGEFILGFVSVFGRAHIPLRSLVPYTSRSLDRIRVAAENLSAKGEALVLRVGPEDEVFDKRFYEDKSAEVRDILENYHRKFPLSEGMAKEELRSRLNLDGKVFEAMLERWVAGGLLESRGKTVNLKGFTVKVSEKQRETIEKLLREFREKGWTPPTLNELMASFSEEAKDVKEVLNWLVSRGDIIKINEEIYMAREWVEKARHLLQEFFAKNSELTVAQFRDMLGTTRKYALPLLEYMDGIKVTRRLKETRAAGIKLYE
ncbi:selenocysteine-specific translation elongation factor [Thermosediminibacter oceani]|uniref:Selenocysteine-specific elongation factor n=1 Tax=Thermosediminibacter oceani (strain ATCC BAA-1034 / DSM 16646 / JW/IW-1228P) TaxID=555079 RepID=D9S2B4_THEOJ|nr:selenocysteine-specific translation elongation factor [Thermosediminibacter oceani]ADL07541.1 selenocysteine-specific translation elongation factor [Thermosediminibacter oceani DSM 16646]